MILLSLSFQFSNHGLENCRHPASNQPLNETVVGVQRPAGLTGEITNYSSLRKPGYRFSS
jgi:hypothetical protein